MAIPLSIFYYLYLVLLAFFLLFTFFNIYHLIRFGFISLSNLVMMAFYLAVSACLISISFNYIGQIDWTQSVQIAAQFQT